jgi:hypothetical protein
MQRYFRIVGIKQEKEGGNLQKFNANPAHNCLRDRPQEIKSQTYETLYPDYCGICEQTREDSEDPSMICDACLRHLPYCGTGGSIVSHF